MRSKFSSVYNPDDEILVNNYKEGDKKAFTKIHDKYIGSVRSYAAHFFYPKYNSWMYEELVQLSFIKISIELLTSYDTSKGTLDKWITVLVRSQALDMLRRQKSEKRWKDAFVFYESHVPSPSSHFENKDFTENILRDLPVEHSSFLNLSYCQGYTHEQIASIMSLPVGTVKTRIRNANKIIRNLHWKQCS